MHSGVNRDMCTFVLGELDLKSRILGEIGSKQVHLLSTPFVIACMAYARGHVQDTALSPTDPRLSSEHATAFSTSNSPPSHAEAIFYYVGTSPSPPKLVYRTGSESAPWIKPKGFEAYTKPTQLRGVFNHPLNALWEELGPLVKDLVNTQGLAWTSIDVVRFLRLTDGEGGNLKVLGPVVLWVGVRPDSLGSESAFNSAKDILHLLVRFNVHDVEVEYRESIYRRSAGPALLRSVSNVNNTVDVRGSLTTALGLSIATTDRDAEGTMALYFAEGGDSTKTLGLTCHHVLLKTDATTNEDYDCQGAGAPSKEVQLLGTRGFEKLLNSIRLRISNHGTMVELYERQIVRLQKALTGDDDELVAEAKQELDVVQSQLKAAKTAIQDLEKFDGTVRADWGTPSNRTIGFIRRSLPVTFNAQPGGFTEDWGAFELDGPKFKEFEGNAIDLGALRLSRLSPGLLD